MGKKIIRKLEDDTAGRKKFILQIDSVPDISNAFVKHEADAFSLGYSFERIELIDMPFETLKGSGIDAGLMSFGQYLPKKRFELHGKELHLIHRSTNPDKNKNNKPATPSTMDELMDEVDYKASFRFKNPVRRVKNGTFERSDDKKTLTITYKMDRDPNAGKTTIIKF